MSWKQQATELQERCEEQLERANKLQAFKDFVHSRLDKAGVPTHPDGPHSKEGCRIGDRLDIVLKGFSHD